MNLRRSLLPDLGTLQVFESAARHGNFSRAADELALTQSTVSRQIKELEQQTGLQLFERIRQRVVLSEAGARLLPEARRLLSEAERLIYGALAEAPARQVLRIGTLPTFGTRWLVPRLGSFVRQHPGMQISLESRDRPFSFDEDPLDLTIHYGKPVWPGGVTSFLCTETVVPVASREMAARLSPVVSSDLIGAELLHLTGRPRLWSQWFEAHADVPAEAWHGARFDQFSMIISAAIAGLGVGLVPLYLIESEITSGALVQLFDAPMETENAYYVVVPEGRTENAAVRQFHDWLQGQISPRGRFRRDE